MSLFQKLFSKKPEPKTRVRVCVECGMPVAEHKDWCSIYRTQQEMAAKARVALHPAGLTVAGRRPRTPRAYNRAWRRS